MKKATKLFALLIAAIMLVGLVACGGEETTTAATQATTAATDGTGSTEATDFENTMPISDEPVTITAWRSWSSTFYNDPNEIPATQELEKLTNVHVDFTCAATSNAQEQFNIMVMSQDYSDMIFGHSYSSQPNYTGGVDKAIADEVYIDITDYLYLATNFNMRLAEDERIEPLITTDGGAKFFGTIQSGEQPAWYGTMVRTDWLEELNIDEPQTISDWYDMLTAFKDNGHANALYFAKTGYDTTGFGIVGAYDTAPVFYNKDGVVTWGGIDEGYKAYLTEMAKWYSEGLIDLDFYSRATADQMTMFAQDKVGASVGASYTTAEQYPLSHGGEGVKWEAVPLPVLEEGTTGHFRRVNLVVGTAACFPTTAAVENGNIETVIRYIDYTYSEEGSAITNYGVEGETWEWGDDGLPHYTDFFLHNEEFGQTDMRNRWCDSNGRGGYYMWIRENDSYSQEVLDGQYKWMDSSSGDWVMPPVTLTSEEANEYATIYGDIETLMQEFTTQVITGQKSIDEWDSYVEQVKGMNIDRCIELQQAALERFNAR